MAEKMVVVELEIESSRYAPGATWVNGGEYYAVTGYALVPESMADEDSEVIEEYATDYETWCDKDGNIYSDDAEDERG